VRPLGGAGFLLDEEFIFCPACCLKRGQPFGGMATSRPFLVIRSPVFRRELTYFTNSAAREKFKKQIVERQVIYFLIKIKM
jgi:hypothetical protein